MRLLRKILKGLALAVVVVLAGASGWLLIAPPDLLRVGTGYAAKMVCSNAFLAGRDPQEVLALDVQAPGHPLLRLVGVVVDTADHTVTARMLGVFAPSIAVYREGLGCASVPDGDVRAAMAVGVPTVPTSSQVDPASPWPQGEAVDAADRRIAALLADPALVGPGMRAVVAVKDGRIVGEVYGEGFSASTPLLGWSMAKTVTGAIIGHLVVDGRLGLDDDRLLPQWSEGPHAAIRLRDLLAMESGLEFNEDYGDVTDVTRMLYLEPDMAAFSMDKPIVAKPGETFNYSSGSSVLLSRIWMSRLPDKAAALAYPRAALFDPLGMRSAVLEADSVGTFVGSSYLYATARDWARFGQFLVEDGVWNGKRLLPEGFVAAIRRPTVASGGRYTEIQAWDVGPGDEPDERFGLNPDTFWLQGHDGQVVAVMPSERLVVVRMGLTPSKLGYRPQKLVKALADALR
ncbi:MULTISPECIES: serine hydrolase domain-containing protein [Alphaproteobacteria]|uniref:6-aminohexanoate-dimer hydrolase n=2 Tax=Alphaproteobacteria TaxID=28211 RepID=A0A512HED0_9HYPH|nr:MULTISPECIES: serine hydrolase [Alphaproteobacteria]GEO83811.1 6-aminohexanoate-dimer hydrolase [Ciceribacter naphthalenivorans]GLR21311.1 6-aminohexanoate-dimer hydrolase [Ciceribacter naphthalenivorans]GLT04167.1 6-aminohexanoate-dimer hydrolase [Sphingomonas psychrolutea]